MNRREIIRILRKYKNNSEYKDYIQEIGIFGSYVAGKNTNKSDIDVFVKLQPPRMFDLIGIKNDIEKLLGKKTDIIAVRDSMNEYLKKQIKQNGIYV
jgi:uncharacterized protein